jgi:DNA-binding winged helix-turn-helix (wHTH) protein
MMLRHALEDSATQRYIVTDHGRGYRFIGDVRERPPLYMAGVVEQYCAAAAEFRNSGSPSGTMAALARAGLYKS